MQWHQALVFLLVGLPFISALPWLEDQVSWNLNQNQSATNPLEYWGAWSDHTYQESPENWRFPFYTITLDRFVNGDPTNDDANGTHWEHDPQSNQFRFGGDLAGLLDTLDYVQGLGIKALYLTGSPMINMPWASDGYSPLDLTLLDHHHGTIADWRTAITEIHARGMYVILDNTMATMGDLIAFEGYLNASTPFDFDEHNFVWKTERRYFDFQPGNSANDSCNTPTFYYDAGYEVGTNVTSKFTCRDSEFDQYGEVSAFGSYPDWQKQVSKFAFVQDRLREWDPAVRAKIDLMSCITIAMLDIDGFRIDKAQQVNVEAQADWSTYIRSCATSLGKTNFFIPGECVDGNTFGSIYHGRGKLPDMAVDEFASAITATNETNSTSYLREFGHSALDSAAFHYSIYRALTRFLGMDGSIGALGDTNYDLVKAWHEIVATNDLVNANTGLWDPRHMFGVTNQDVFRYPGLANGTQRQLLGMFVTTLMLPGIPLMVWGEEQAMYVLDSQASNYVYGRAPMSSNQAWQMHGCYKLEEVWYSNMLWDSALVACEDDSVSLDHRDSSNPIYGIMKRMYQLREAFPVLNDGFVLEQLSNRTYDYLFSGANNPTEFGIRSVLRSRAEGVQDLTGSGQGNQSVWLIYQNDNATINYAFDCSSSTDALLSPFPYNTTVQNLFWPYETYNLSASNQILGFEGSTEYNGCIDELTLLPYEYKVLVPLANFVQPRPMVTRVLPGHDSRILSTVSADQAQTIAIQIHYSSNMSCDSVKESLYFNSTTEKGLTAELVEDSVNCVSVETDEPSYVGGVPTAWIFKANITNVYNGVHTFTTSNATSESGDAFTNAIDHYQFRVGLADNPIVFPKSANYSRSLLQKDASTGDLYVVHNAAGADKFRYSLNWGSSWSNWTTYSDSNFTLTAQSWTGTSSQRWDGEHVIIQYWSRLAGSADHIQHGDLDSTSFIRHFPHFFAEGKWNQYGYDNGLPQSLKLVDNSIWEFNLMAEWPNTVAFNVWGMNPSGLPDKTTVFGDVDGDGILDRVPPITLLSLNVTLTDPPAMPYLSYKLTVNDDTLGYSMTPSGSAWHQLIMSIFFALIPPLTGLAAIFLFKRAFYQVKHNYIGVSEKEGWLASMKIPLNKSQITGYFKNKSMEEVAPVLPTNDPLAMAVGAPNRRKVLIATMEYHIIDWDIKVKIGGLGVMASLMGQNLGHQDLIWVIPCVGGINYPRIPEESQEPMTITVLGLPYDIEVAYHVVRNITYVLLDAPVFRNQTKSEPYPPRMDDVESAIYYSAWNSCIAETIKRFNPDIYHINDYHGAVAPLHLLPQTIPVCLSLHNAEFQGLWPMRTPKEIEEVCLVYNLDPSIVKKYVQFGEVFNLLHAGASYLRVHQKGFGAVGVSKKYGVRSFARYPIFWGLKEIGALPNPDPSDTADWDRATAGQGLGDVQIDAAVEAARGDLRVQTQKWAGLNIDPKAELFVFVGRWSMQKGIDLIADVFPAVLEENSNVQLLCVGPVIDLYGKFAAMKLDKMMQKYPGRVYSKPEFTALPPFIFSGAEFALIPSRDEPFGLVAVEFGRKGALGVGARVGGLGQMPGWWFTIESTTTRHLMRQFKIAIKDALAAKTEVRAMMRARSALQRFPVAEWVEDLETLQSTSIKIHQRNNDPNAVVTPGLSGYARSIFSSSMTTLGSAQRSRSSSINPSGVVNSSSIGPGKTKTINISSMNPSRNASRDDLRDHGRHASSSSSLRLELPTKKDFKKKPRRSLFTFGADEDSDAGSEMGAPDGHSRNDSYGMSPMTPNTRSPTPGSGGLRSRSGSFVAGRQLAGGPWNPANPSANASSTDILDEFAPFVPPFAQNSRPTSAQSTRSVLSLDLVIGDRKDFQLQAVDPFFTDSTGTYGTKFEGMLADLDGKSSEGQLCIEEYLVKSEKNWFGRFHDAKMGKTPNSPAASFFRMPWLNQSKASDLEGRGNASGFNTPTNDDLRQFELHEDYTAPTGLRRLMQQKLGDWPIYAFLLAFGQIIAANSYQITLLIGQNGEAASELYTVASIYLFASACWWLVFRRFQAIYVLSTPFAFYGMAFFLVGMVPFCSNSTSKKWMQNVATALYAIASSSGSLFFANNFGSEGGAPIESWAFRACVIQGTQQIYVSALWYWGSRITKTVSNGVSTSSFLTSTKAVAGITTPLALLLWGVGAILYFGLPTYYRQKPGTTPSFYHSILRRKIILWFLLVVVIQNYWLSAPYGRNWAYLWSSAHAPTYSVVLLIFLFFVVIWALLLGIFGYYSKSHSWILPLFAIGLGAPRWCQMLWGTSNIGLYVPWAGSAVSSALMGRTLWLWLGVLDAIQGVGFGMILLQTLTRLHISFTLIAAQIIGSLATIAARASAPNKIGPGTVFPDFSGGLREGLREHWFWIALIFQLLVCVGFFKFFRKEQLFKP